MNIKWNIQTQYVHIESQRTPETHPFKFILKDHYFYVQSIPGYIALGVSFSLMNCIQLESFL